MPISNFPKSRDVLKAPGFDRHCDLCDFYIYVNVVQYGQQTQDTKVFFVVYENYTGNFLPFVNVDCQTRKDWFSEAISAVFHVLQLCFYHNFLDLVPRL